MTAIIFQPWIGSEYRSCDCRLMLVGESHYGEPHEDPAEATRTVVSKWKQGEWNIRYLVAAARVLTGLERWHLDRNKHLEKIAFYNFVQVMMPWSNVRPTAEQFRASAPAFNEAVKSLDPTHILVTGTEVWRYLPTEGPFESTRFCKVDGGQTVPHTFGPSESHSNSSS